MTRPSKRKSIVKEQRWDNNRKFAKRSRVNDNWEDENDSGWDEIYLPNEEKNKSKLVWSDNAHLKQKKREPYLTGTIKKLTYFDKYGPSGSFTRAAKGTVNILIFINKQTISDDFDEVLDDVKNEYDDQLNINERIESLKVEFKEKQKKLSVSEFNKKWAIFEYLRRLNDDGNGKVKASKEAVQLVFIESASYRAWTIRYWANYWI